MNVRLIIIQFVLIACTSCSSDKILIKGCGIPIVLNEIKTSLVDTAFFQASSIIPLESNDPQIRNYAPNMIQKRK